MNPKQPSCNLAAHFATRPPSSETLRPFCPSPLLSYSRFPIPLAPPFLARLLYSYYPFLFRAASANRCEPSRIRERAGETLGEPKLLKREVPRCAPGDLQNGEAGARMVAAEAAGGGPGGGVEEGVGESSSPPRDAAPAPAASGGSGGGGARNICGQVYERLVADGHEGASDPEFLENIVAHFARLPHRFDR
jgi:hypothetical protein